MSSEYVHSATRLGDRLPPSLAEVLVKQVISGDTLTARFLNREFFEFRARFKLFLAANHKPVIRGTDEGIWRRIRLIPCCANRPCWS
jgi:putative DNA primase/helicase